MDSTASGFFSNPSAFQSFYYESKEDDGIIAIGLGLRTLQPEAYDPSGNCMEFIVFVSVVSQEGYGDPTDRSQANPSLRYPNPGYQRIIEQDCDAEVEGVQSSEGWAYLKVNMDGVIVGRKICMMDHDGYSSLALQLEDMFGTQSASGLKLFQAGSEFCLFYKDRRTTGGVLVMVYPGGSL